MKLFLNWLLITIKRENIDVLLISGDIFDTTTPSNNDKKLYFNFLKKIRELNTKTIITGGNHDSISLLNASKNYLLQDNIYVIGGATEDIKEQILHFSINNEEVTICAVPFLRDKDLRKQEIDKEFNSRHEALQYGLQQHYQNIFSLATKKYPHNSIIAMGHLFAIGSSTSDSERDIHIGNSGAVSHTIFNGFDYVALGHIHKPQIINKNERIRYSGSPIPLSFSEKKDEKQIVTITIENNKIVSTDSIKIPVFRYLKRFSGDIQTIKENLLTEKTKENKLATYLELKIEEETYNLNTIKQVNEFIEEFNKNENIKIIHHSITFKEGTKNISELLEKGISIEDLSVNEVFKKRIKSELPDIDTKEEEDLISTFHELKDQYNNSLQS